jgi:hypothetical protein
MKTTAGAELAWLVDDLVARIPQAQQAILLSAGGMLMAASAGRTSTGLRVVRAGQHLGTTARRPAVVG